MRLFFLLLAILSTVSAGNKEWTLDEIIEFADRNSDQVSIIDQTRNQNIAEIDIYKASAFPRLDTEISVMRTSVPTRSIFSQQSFFQSTANQGTTNQAYPDSMYSSQYGLNLNLSAPIYTFGRFGSVLDIARKMERKVDLEKDLARTNHHLSTITLYTDALLAVNLEKVSATSEKL